MNASVYLVSAGAFVGAVPVGLTLPAELPAEAQNWPAEAPAEGAQPAESGDLGAQPAESGDLGAQPAESAG